MIIKALLDELFMQIKEFIDFDNIGIYKIISDKEYQRYYYSPKNKLEYYDVDIVMEKIIKEECLSEITKLKKEILIKDSDILNEKISMNLIPIMFEEEVVFFLNLLTNKKFDVSEEIKEKVLELIDSFSEVFCFEEMMKVDMIRDRMSLDF